MSDFLLHGGMLYGDSNEYTQYTILSIKKKITLNLPKYAAMDFFQGTQERVRNSQGKRAIRVRATEVLLYFIDIYKMDRNTTCILLSASRLALTL